MKLAAVLLTSLLVGTPALAQDQFYPTRLPPPVADDFRADCQTRRSAETCSCMSEALLRTGAGQVAIELASIRLKNPTGPSTTEMAAILAAHQVPADQARELENASKASMRAALGACR